MSRSLASSLTNYTAVLAAGLLWGDASASAAEPRPFSVASVHLEQNATDGDMEIVFTVQGAGDGMSSLKVVSPDGRAVIDFTAPGSSRLGIRQFRFETPEPRDVAALKAAYPEGAYAFTGTGQSGRAYAGRSMLRHGLPTPARIRVPAAEAEGVPADGLEISWDAVSGAASYIVELEQEESKTSVRAVLPGSSTSMFPPKGFLRPGTEYHLAVGTVAGDGNISFVEISFTTRR